MEQLLPGTDRAQVRQFFGELQVAHRSTRQERLGGVFDGAGWLTLATAGGCGI